MHLYYLYNLNYTQTSKYIHYPSSGPYMYGSVAPVVQQRRDTYRGWHRPHGIEPQKNGPNKLV